MLLSRPCQERLGGVDFPVRPWSEIVAFYQRLADDGYDWIAPMLDIARSVIDEGASGELLAHTSMHDLKVTTPPRPTWARADHVHVELLPDRRGVRIRHRAMTGPDDSIERPNSDAVSLFWRFMIEKYGVHPARDWD